MKKIFFIALLLVAAGLGSSCREDQSNEESAEPYLVAWVSLYYDTYQQWPTNVGVINRFSDELVRASSDDREEIQELSKLIQRHLKITPVIFTLTNGDLLLEYPKSHRIRGFRLSKPRITMEPVGGSTKNPITNRHVDPVGGIIKR